MTKQGPKPRQKPLPQNKSTAKVVPLRERKKSCEASTTQDNVPSFKTFTYSAHAPSGLDQAAAKEALRHTKAMNRLQEKRGQEDLAAEVRASWLRLVIIIICFLIVVVVAIGTIWNLRHTPLPTTATSVSVISVFATIMLFLRSAVMNFITGKTNGEGKAPIATIFPWNRKA